MLIRILTIQKHYIPTLFMRQVAFRSSLQVELARIVLGVCLRNEIFRDEGMCL